MTNEFPSFEAGPLEYKGLRYGQIVKYPDGYRFLPATPTHKPSRKAHVEPLHCVPRWVLRAIRKAM